MAKAQQTYRLRDVGIERKQLQNPFQQRWNVMTYEREEMEQTQVMYTSTQNLEPGPRTWTLHPRSKFESLHEAGWICAVLHVMVVEYEACLCDFSTRPLNPDNHVNAWLILCGCGVETLMQTPPKRHVKTKKAMTWEGEMEFKEIWKKRDIQASG